MITSSATFCEGATFAEICWESQRRYAARLGRDFQCHRVSRALGDFEHRLPTMLQHDAPVQCYLEWDVLVSDDAPDLFALLGDADVLLADFPYPRHAEVLGRLVPALQAPWNMIPIMVIRHEALKKIAEIQPHCHAYTRKLPTGPPAYEGTVLMAIQQANLKLRTLPAGLHVLASEGVPAPFLHFEGKKSKTKLTHETLGRYTHR